MSLFENEFTFGRASASNSYGDFIEDEFNNRLVEKPEFDKGNLDEANAINEEEKKYTKKYVSVRYSRRWTASGYSET